MRSVSFQGEPCDKNRLERSAQEERLPQVLRFLVKEQIAMEFAVSGEQLIDQNSQHRLGLRRVGERTALGRRRAVV